MLKKTRHPGAFTLFELMVAVAIIALMVAIALPSVRSMRKSYDSTGAESMINAAMSTARAIAAREQRYAGVRFQMELDANTPMKDPKFYYSAPQYMIFIIHDMDATGLAKGFRAYQSLKPIKLPANIGLMDMRIRTNWNDGDESKLDNQSIKTDGDIQDDKQVTDTTTFSVVFSPSGKLIITDVRTRNDKGVYRPDNSGATAKQSYDSVFNSIKNIYDLADKTGLVVQDDYAQYGLGGEYSRGSFVIYDREQFKNIKPARRWTDYLWNLKVYNINGYTGTIIETN